MPVVDNPLSKAEIISRFGAWLRTHILSENDWVASSVIVPGHTAANITGGTTPKRPSGMALYGGNPPNPTMPADVVLPLPSGRAMDTAEPGLPTDANFLDSAEADLTQGGSVTRVLRDFMIVYARSQRVFFTNTGNLGGSVSGVIRLSTSNGLDTAMGNQVNSAVTNRGLTGDAVINASNLENFLSDCRNIWTNLCNTSNVATYQFYYCHTNHSNYSQHGSRGRR
jgi:hypothetical protein